MVGNESVNPKPECLQLQGREEIHYLTGMIAENIFPKNPPYESPSAIRFDEIKNSYQFCVKSKTMAKIMNEGCRGIVTNANQ